MNFSECESLLIEEYKKLDKMELAMYFMNESSRECPVLLYDGEEYYGMITY